MKEELFFAKIRTYTTISRQAEMAWSALLRGRQIRKDDNFIKAGEAPTSFAFVVEGLLYQHYVGPDGGLVVKHFFPEGRIAGSISATLLGTPSLFTITAIESSSVLEYDFDAFKKLVAEFPKIAAF